MVTSSVSALSGTHTKPPSVTPMFTSYCPRSHLKLKYFLEVRHLGRATAIALDLILRSVCPRSFGLDTLPGILQKLTVLLQQLPDDADPVVYNQDLVGFFTSIPVSRILNAVRWAVTEYCLVKDVDLESTSFSVNLQEQDTKLRIWKGRPRKAAKRALLIHLSDIVDSQLSCDASVFTVMHKHFVNVAELQSGTRSPRCSLDLLLRLKKRFRYSIYKASFLTTANYSCALVTSTIGLW